jgi:hypothetical protein
VGGSYYGGAFAVGVAGAAPELVAGVFPSLGGAQGHGFAAPRALGDEVGRIGRIGRITVRAPGESCGGQLFGVAALLDERLLERADLLVEQVVGLVNQADDGVGADAGLGLVEPGGVEGMKGAAAGLRIARVRRIRLITPALSLSDTAHGEGFRARGCPLGQKAVEEIILEWSAHGKGFKEQWTNTAGSATQPNLSEHLELAAVVFISRRGFAWCYQRVLRLGYWEIELSGVTSASPRWIAVAIRSRSKGSRWRGGNSVEAAAMPMSTGSG